MAGFRSKRRKDGSRYSHPVGTLMSAELRGLTEEHRGQHTFDCSECRNVIQKAAIGHPHPGEEMEHNGQTPNVTVQPPISITVQSGGASGTQSPQPPREPMMIAPSPLVPEAKSPEYPSATLNGEWDVIEPELYKMFNVVNVHKSFARGKVTVEMTDGTKLIYHRKKDNLGNQHWTRREKDIIKPKMADEDGDDDDDAEEPSMWD